MRAVHGSDPQQRFLSALVLAQAGKTDHVKRLTEILLPHLADNELRNDAGIAAHAIYRLGPAAWPYLEPLLGGEDHQQTTLAQSIMAQGLDPDAKPNRGLLALPGFGRRNPVRERSSPGLKGWAPERFPSHDGH